MLHRGSATGEGKMANARIFERERFFREFALWPHEADFDVQGWLGNFLPGEKPYAERLLLSFCYFNDRMVDALLKVSLKAQISNASRLGLVRTNGQQIDISGIAFVICEGEVPHPTDSGNLFARKLRDKFDIPEQQIMTPKQALEQSRAVDYFIFFDDFVGSGNQFLETIDRDHGSLAHRSFRSLNAARPNRIGYSPCIATRKSKDRFEREIPSVLVTPAHFLDRPHSALRPQSLAWQGVNWRDGVTMIRASSRRAGYFAEDKGQDDWRGFHGLGLSVGFGHGIPDACLPIYFSSRNGWVPLMKRPE